MTHQRRQRLYRARIGSLSWMICLALVFVTASLPISSITTHAQLGTPLLSVYADPTMVVPGQSVSFTVFASGSGSRTQIDVLFPNDLTLSNEVGCVHSPLFCDGWSVASEDSRTNRLTVTAPGNVPGPDGPRGYTRVTVTFTLRVPVGAIPGSQIQVISSVDGLFDVLEPLSTSNNRIATTIEVLGESGQRVPPPSPPTPTPVPALNTAHTIRFDIRQGDVLPVTYLVPGENYNFTVFQGFMSVAGSYSLTITIPNGLTILGEPECNVTDAGSCNQPEVTVEASGATSVQIVGENTIADPVSLDFEVMASSSVAVEIPIEITGRYSVTDASTNMEYQSDLWSPLYFTDLDTALATSTEEGMVRVTFNNSGQLTDELGGCVALSQDGRWTPYYFVCDNDSAAAEPPVSGSAILTDFSPIAGEIVVSVTTGTYYVTVESVPAEFALESTNGPDTITVLSEGAGLTIDLLSP